MEWKKLSDELPEIGRPLLLYGKSESGNYRFDVGNNDKEWGVCIDYGPPLEVTYWAYCEKPGD